MVVVADRARRSSIRFEGFYQKKLPVLIILNSEMITKANAADYYHPDAPF